MLTDKTCRDTVWFTPPWIVSAVHRYFAPDGIALDPATDPSNPTKALYHFTEEENGLMCSWAGYGGVFVNPPYGKHLMSWVVKICHEATYGTPIVALLPGQRFETKVWQEKVLTSPALDAIVFIRGRVKFLRPSGEQAKSNPYGSMLYVFNRDYRALEPLSALGVTLAPVFLHRNTK